MVDEGAWPWEGSLVTSSPPVSGTVTLVSGIGLGLHLPSVTVGIATVLAGQGC